MRVGPKADPAGQSATVRAAQQTGPRGQEARARQRFAETTLAFSEINL